MPPSTASRNVAVRLKRQLPTSLLRRLREAGRLGEARRERVFAAGGLVRDLLLGRPNLDLDLVVEGDGVGFARRLAARHGAGVYVHPRFGTASIYFPDKRKIDVVTARLERYAHPVALPVVTPSSIERDLFRRDFTINALAVSLNPDTFGDLLDPFGGVRDLQSKILRVLHPESLEDDPTRMFRAVRFSTRYRFRLSPDMRHLIRRAIAKRLVARLSAARLRQEVILLLSEEEPWNAVAGLAALDLLRSIHPGLHQVSRTRGMLKAAHRALVWHRRTMPGVAVDPWMAYLFVLLDASSDRVAGAVLARLGVAARTARNLMAARQARPLLQRCTRGKEITPAEVSRALRDLSEPALLYLLARSSPAVGRRIKSHMTRYRTVAPLLRGTDLQALGLAPGPAYRQILDSLRDARLNGEIRTREEERALARRLIRD